MSNSASAIGAGDSPAPEFTSEQLQRLIFAATEAGDMEAVEHAMRYMAVFYPDDAQLIIDAVKFAHRGGKPTDQKGEL
jgi:hypothetical protein